MSGSPDTLTIQPSGALHGRLRVPGDKSISHRALMLGAIAQGETRVTGLLEAQDTQATARCLRAMGVTIEKHNGATRIRGVGLNGLRAPGEDLDCGNSGTTMRLLAGILAGQPFTTTLTGDASLARRPMRRIIKPLQEMGARAEAGKGARPPLKITGKRPLHALHHSSPHASAQVKSCVLLAGLYADGQTVVTEPGASRDHTERMLRAMGATVEPMGNQVSIEGGADLRGIDFTVPGDTSAAAFFAVAATIVPESDIVLEGVGVNPTRDGFIHVLRQMGADITLHNETEVGGEPVADLHVRYAPLEGVRIDPYLVPIAIDEFPALFVAAACAQGESTLTGAGELRVKESDRITVMADALQTLGIRCKESAQGVRIQGGTLQGGEVGAAGDHRCAMALAIAGLAARDAVTVHGAGNIATSYPGFTNDLHSLTT